MIDSVRIRNFKSIKNIDLKLEKLNILSGVNSSGKSTILNSFLLIKQLDCINKKINLNGYFCTLGTFEDILFQWAEDDYIELSFRIEDKEITLRAHYDNKNRSVDYLNLIGEITDFEFIQKLASKIKYISAERISPNFSFPLNSQSADNLYVGKNGEDTISVLSKLKDIEIKEASLLLKDTTNSHHNPTSLLSITNAWMQQISPEVMIKADAIEEVRASNISFGYKSERFMKKSNSLNVGFGLTYVLPVIVSGLLASPGDLLIVENPEAHLHPSGQTNMGIFLSKLASTGVQVMIETHSDHVFNGIRIAAKEKIIPKNSMSLLYISRKTSNAKSAVNSSMETSYDLVKISDDGRITNAPNGFFDEWETSLFKLL